ncbi:MAG: hypothetical protein CMO66_03450 [Verrucomicrobiales bacterium]|nr:hypothetical protein [Verrucomicrobiales bacterium]
MPDRETLLLIDGHAAAYRAFYAIRNLTGPDGAPTNAIFGFLKAFHRDRERVEPTQIAVVWDGGLDEERTEMLPGYKSERDPMPDAMEAQLDGMVEWLEASGIASICEEGVEADDIIATLARRAEASGQAVVIASADKDFFQLINDRIGLLNPNDKTGVIWSDGQVFDKTGVRPEQIVDWLSLVGDAVDDIPGVSGVGPKTAAKWLAKFGTLDALLEGIDEVTPERFREPLRELADDLRRNQDLVRLREDLPVPTAPASLVPSDGDYARLHALYTRWGFRGFLTELESARQPDLL